MKRSRSIIFLLIVLIVVVVFSSCRRDDNNPGDPPKTPNEEEVITTMRLFFTDAAGVASSFEATFSDPDGTGGNAPTIHDDITLQSSTTYHVSILLLDETQTPADTISNEVIEEAADHLFCFNVSGADISIVKTDSDGIYPLGIQSDWTTGMAGIGSVTVTLKHQPGIKDGTCDPGETDVEVSFVVAI